LFPYFVKVVNIPKGTGVEGGSKCLIRGGIWEVRKEVNREVKGRVYQG
jgi:hypothetical protein